MLHHDMGLLKENEEMLRQVGFRAVDVFLK